MKNKTFIRTIKVIKKRVKLGSALALLLTFSVNTFAWFIYATKVDSGVTAHVRAWNVSFEVGEEEIEEYMSFNISEIYPGMATYTDRITIKNKGESDANISFEVVSVSILGEVYEVTTDGSLTSDDLLNSLSYDYPFQISLYTSNNLIAPESEETFNLKVFWPFESGDDETDTYWGSKAYDYSISNPDDPSIILNIKASAVQSNN